MSKRRAHFNVKKGGYRETNFHQEPERQTILSGSGERDYSKALGIMAIVVIVLITIFVLM